MSANIDSDETEKKVRDNKDQIFFIEFFEYCQNQIQEYQSEIDILVNQLYHKNKLIQQLNQKINNQTTSQKYYEHQLSPPPAYNPEIPPPAYNSEIPPPTYDSEIPHSLPQTRLQEPSDPQL